MVLVCLVSRCVLYIYIYIYNKQYLYIYIYIDIYSNKQYFVGGACSAYGGGERCVQGFGGET